MDTKKLGAETFSYAEAGVDEPREQETLKKISHWFKETYSFRQGIGSTTHSIGHFANALDMGAGLGLVLTTDGVGTKLLIAQKLHKFDTVGIDCVANNVNDILCMGAEPVALLDYIAINTIDETVLEDIAKGLCYGAKKAHISIPGGEIAQVREMLSNSSGEIALDLVGSAIGVVGLSSERQDLLPLIDGKRVEPGDVIIGMVSSGLHSNGYSLARRVLFDHAKLQVDEYISDLGRTVGEELLEPTLIYVDPVLNILRRRLPIRGMVHISGGGLLNLARLPSNCGYIIERLPPVPQICRIIQEYGSVPDAAMFSTFNMGIGFCLVTNEESSQIVLDTISSSGYDATILGRVINDPERRIFIEPYSLVGLGEVFQKRL